MKWEAKPLTHKKEQRIAVFFEKKINIAQIG